MRILLTAINAKYIHSNLAVYSLKGSAGKYEPMTELAEYTINHQMEEIFAGIYRKKPELLLFSCYIWNRREVVETAESIKKVLPDVKIWAGGPEVSYDAKRFLKENPAFDGVMIGEGERTFYRLLEYYVDGIGTLEELSGVAFRERAHSAGLIAGFISEQDETSVAGKSGGCEVTAGCDAQIGRVSAEKIRLLPPAEPMKTLDELPFVYGDLQKFENRIIYYETSRGCPFSCSYCLSSVDKRVRYRSLDLVKKELQYFLDKRVKQVKFVDRTFNCSHARTLELWRFLRDHDNGVTNFHCEISADLLNEEELELLGTLRPGLLQLEIGVQTVNRDALAAIHRTAPFEKIAEHVNRVQGSHNVHQHLDLIAGLPYEDFESFRHSFDTVYALYPQELQLGFLKVLKGSEMYLRAQEYGIVYRSTPPYEVLQTRWITCGELLRLKEIEEMLEVYYNSLQYRNTMHAAEALFARPIELYEALADYYKEESLGGKSYSRMQRIEILRGFLHREVQKQNVFPEKYFDELLTLDLYLRENAKSRPAWSGDQEPEKEMAIGFYQREEEAPRYLKTMAQTHSWKQMLRMTHLEHFHTLAREGEFFGYAPQTQLYLLFSYEERDPLTGDARIVEIPRDHMAECL